MSREHHSRTKVAVIGSGNIGTDLMIKVLRLSDSLETAAMAGIDPASDGLARARRLKVATTHEGVEGLVAMDEFADVEIVFDATSAGAHRHHEDVLRPWAVRSSTSPRPPSARTWSRRSTATRTSTRPTSTWSPAAARPRSRWSPR